LKLDDLTMVVEDCIELLEEFFETKKVDPLKGVASILLIYIKANALLEKAKSFEERNKIFDEVLKLHPYLSSDKMKIFNNIDEGKQTKEVILAFAALEEERTRFEWYLNRTLKEHKEKKGDKE